MPDGIGGGIVELFYFGGGEGSIIYADVIERAAPRIANSRPAPYSKIRCTVGKGCCVRCTARKCAIDVYSQSRSIVRAYATMP
jgi:hypothetical protein